MIGEIVVLIEPFEFNDKTYQIGHQFTITDTSYRGWDLKDKDGNRILETRWIQDKFISLSEARDRKLNILL